jgi:tetratricopeptide (TPR) repeat protein
MADKRQNPSTEPPAAVKPRARWVGILLAAAGPALSNPFRLVLTLAVNVAIVVGLVATAVILRNYKPPPKPATLEAALAALDRGDADEARSLAERLAAKPDIANEEYGAPDFILGVLAVREADSAGGNERSEAFRMAALHLQRSRKRGFPARRETTGLYLLGKSLCLCGRLDDALPVLEDSLRSPAGHESEVRGMLISARCGVYPPELSKALDESKKLVADPTLSDEARRQALLDQARILFRMERRQDCAALLDKLPDDLLLRGRVALLRGQIELAEGHATTAIGWFDKALSQSAGDKGIASQANYLKGVGLAAQGDLPKAVVQLERTGKLYPNSPEYMAALFHEGDIYRRMGRHGESVTAYRRLLSAYRRMDEFHNPWINAPQIQTTILAVCRDYVKAEKYNTALLLNESLAGLLPKVEALKLTAEIYRNWGENFLEEAERLPPERAEQRRKEARFALRRAGDSCTEIARELFTSRDYPEQLWNAAAAYFAGHDFRSAARMIRMYLKNETDPRGARDAQALVDLGEAEISLGETDAALEALQGCMGRHPHDVAVYRARLLAHRAAIAQGDLKQAEAFLRENLDGEQLTPASKEWRESLFALGDLLHLAGRDAEAIPRLEEALQRYPEAPQAVSARYLLADSSRRLALTLRSGLAKEVSSTARNDRRAEIDRHFLRALEVYAALQSDLSRRDTEDLAEPEKAVLRNARFALGDVYRDLGRYAEALRAYQSAANHYSLRPEALDAYLQIANVYRRMNRPAEARTSLEQARIALRRIPPDVRFEQTTNFNRKQWGELLDRLCSL